MALKARSLALAILTTGLGLAWTTMQPGVAAAQACRIGNGTGSSWTEPAHIAGAVIQFGDLKIRIATIDSTSSSVTLDIKTPGGVLHDQYFKFNEPRRYTICGQDVMISYTGFQRVISVSVF